MSKIGQIKWFFAVFHKNEAFMLDNTHFQAVLMFSGQNIGLFGHFGQKLKKMKIWPKCGKISKNLDFFYYIIIGIRIAFQRGVNHFSIFFLSRDIEFIPNFSHLGTQCTVRPQRELILNSNFANQSKSGFFCQNRLVSMQNRHFWPILPFLRALRATSKLCDNIYFLLSTRKNDILTCFRKWS